MVANVSDNKTVAITDSLTLTDHVGGQVANKFDSTNKTDAELFAFRLLTPTIQNVSVSGIVFWLYGVNGIQTGDLTNMRLYRDMNANKIYDAGDIAVGGAGVVSINGQMGTIIFSTPFNVTTSQDYLLVGNVSNINIGDSMTVSTNITTATGVTTSASVTKIGSAMNIQHIRLGSGALKGIPNPTEDTTVTTVTTVTTGGSSGGGGAVIIDPNSGATIGNEPGFNAPGTNGSPFNAWINGGNAYASDGLYTTTSSTNAQQSYGTFGFSVPSNNIINGIAVKLEASASPAVGTISVRLSWNGGSSVTALKTTGTLGLTDAVYTLGGSSDTWGRSWTPAELNNGNFTIELVGNPSSNNLRVDAIQVSAYYVATGGGAGGGGGEVLNQNNQPSQYLANASSAKSPAWSNIIRSVLSWFLSL
jgi:hypothetical protein